MKYSEILNFEPITEVVQFDNLKDQDYQRDLVKTFVYPDYFMATVIPQIVKQLKFDSRDQKGIQIVGNYGTGKSHLMSLVSLVAENADYIDLINNPQAKEILKPIAGKFKVLRFEMGTDKRLWDIVTYQLQEYMQSIGIDYRFDSNSMKMYREQLEDMLAAFEDKYPDQGLLLVIDEMLSYLEVSSENGMLSNDLQVLQALGQFCSNGHFGFMFGVQEMIYQSKKFQFAAETLLKVKDRFIDLTIRKEDVAYVVQNRLLPKTAEQKAAIRSHLHKFMGMFSDMHDHLQDYIDLFPVHPAYFDNFQKIRIGRSQREVLRTLSAEFQRIADTDVPADNPGLISYDSYLQKMMSEPGNMTIPDFKIVADTVRLIHGKIDSNFDGIRARKAPLGKRITNATAIKLLQGELDKPNGARAEVLTDELCYNQTLDDDHQLLVDIVDSTAKLIIKATSGQYFEQDETSSEYRLRTKGGVNFEQQINEYAENLSPAQKDDAFFRFLIEFLGMSGENPYRAGFRIYQHQLEWRSHRINRDGYIFMGNPNDKSTTQPRQSFYMVFMPIFQDNKKKRNDDADEIYFVMDDMPDDFRELVCKFGAAFTLYNSADSSQKVHYRSIYEALLKKTGQVFSAHFLDLTKVYYANNEPRILKSYQLPGAGAANIDYFNRAASDTFEDQFKEQAPHYPLFAQVSQAITKQNRDHFIKSAKAKVIKPSESNRDGEAVLAALGCFSMGELSSADSIYAQSVIDRLEEKGQGKVLNRDEILQLLVNSDGRIWRTIDFQIESDLEFLVLAAMVQTGEIEITLRDGSQVNASNIEVIRNLGEEDYWSFSSVKRPKGINIPVIKAITTAFCDADLSARLDDSSTYAKLVAAGRSLASEAVNFIGRKLSNGPVVVAGTEILSEGDVLDLKNHLTALRGFGDKLATFTSQARLKNMPWDVQTITTMVGYHRAMKDAETVINAAKGLESKVNYLTQALQYVPVNSDLELAMRSAIGRFQSIVQECRTAGGDNPDVRNYNRELDDVKAKYIKWYLGLYRNFCLNDMDEADKVKLLNSPEYKALNKIADLPIVNAAVLANIRADIMKLKTADPNVENNLQASPFANFDPRTAHSGGMKSIRELSAEVKDLFAEWRSQIVRFIGEKQQQESLRLMNQQSQDFANSIVQGLEDLADENTARAVVEFVNTLASGFQRVEITAHDLLANVFNRPLSVADAQAAFERFLINKTRGKDSSKVRIVLNSNPDNR